MTDQGSDLAPLKDPTLADNIAHGIGHGFFGRAGGLSTGDYRGLNCGFGSDDDAATVEANRARVANALSLEASNLLTVASSSTKSRAFIEPDRSIAMTMAIPSRLMVVVESPVRGPASANASNSAAAANIQAGTFANRTRKDLGASLAIARLE